MSLSRAVLLKFAELEGCARIVYGTATGDNIVPIGDSTSTAATSALIPVKSGDYCAVMEAINGDRLILGPVDKSPPWIAPTLQNSWVNFGGGYRPAGYKLEGKTVTLRGLIKDGTTTSATTLLTLPAGYRPSIAELFNARTSVGSIAVEVHANGVVYFAGAASSWLSLAGISFDID